MCKLHKPIYIIIECYTGVAYCRETNYAKALEIVRRLNKTERTYRYCIQEIYN